MCMHTYLRKQFLVQIPANLQHNCGISFNNIILSNNCNCLQLERKAGEGAFFC